MAEANANAGVHTGEVLHGGRMWLAINGRPVGYTQSISVTKSLQNAPADVLDDITTAEHVPVSVTYNGTINVLKLVGRTLDEIGLDVPLDNLVEFKPQTVTLHDRPTAKAVWTLEGFRTGGVSFTLQKGMLTAESVPFVAIKMRNANGVTI